MRAITFAAVLALAMALAGTAHADLSQKDVQQLVDKVAKGVGFHEGHVYPSKDVQIVSVHVTEKVSFWIGLKPRVCLVGNVGVIPVRCAAIKRAYPLLAPLITSED